MSAPTEPAPRKRQFGTSPMAAASFVLVALPYLVMSALAILAWVSFAAFSCIEGCGPQGDWATNTQAWQWKFFGVSSLALIALVAFLVIAVGNRIVWAAFTGWVLQAALVSANLAISSGRIGGAGIVAYAVFWMLLGFLTASLSLRADTSESD